MIYVKKMSDNEYVKVPDFAKWYLNCLEISVYGTYYYGLNPTLISMTEEASEVGFYDRKNKVELTSDIVRRKKNTKWYIKNGDQTVATFNDNELKCNRVSSKGNELTYTVSKEESENKFTIKVISGFSGITSQISVEQKKDGKIYITLQCKGSRNNYKIDTVLPVSNKGYQSPCRYFDTIDNSVNPSYYFQCSSLEIAENDEDAKLDLKLLSIMILDQCLEDRLQAFINRAPLLKRDYDMAKIEHYRETSNLDLRKYHKRQQVITERYNENMAAKDTKNQDEILVKTIFRGKNRSKN